MPYVKSPRETSKLLVRRAQLLGIQTELARISRLTSDLDLFPDQQDVIADVLTLKTQVDHLVKHATVPVRRTS